MSNSTYVKKILILAANPISTTRLRLDEEVREIDEGLRRSNQRDKFKLEQKWAVRQRDFYRAILDHQPQIVHFCGHGAGSDGIVLEDETGVASLVTTNILKSQFELFATKGVKCVVLNACYSAQQAQAIHEYVNYVIGTNSTVGDKAAIAFAVAFYDAIAAGEEVEFAYKLGCSQIMNFVGQERPVLLKKENNTVTPVTKGIISPDSYQQFATSEQEDAIFKMENDALLAEVQKNSQLAKQLWIRVLALSPNNLKAIEGIERLARIVFSGHSYGTTDIQHPVETLFAIRHQSFEVLTARVSEDSLSARFRHYKIQHIEFDQSSFFTNTVYDPVSAIRQNNKFINNFLTVFQANPDAVFGYYGIVHIPLQFCAGCAVSTWPKIVLFELNRSTNSWYELASNDSPKLDLNVSNISRPANPVAVVIRITISYDISKNDVDDVVPQPYEDIKIEIGQRRIDAITHYSQVNELCQAFRQVLDDLHTRVDKSVIVHVFYSGPVSLGFSLGRQISRTVHHLVIVYNYTARTSPRYAWGVKVNSDELPESRVFSTKLLIHDD